MKLERNVQKLQAALANPKDVELQQKEAELRQKEVELRQTKAELRQTEAELQLKDDENAHLKKRLIELEHEVCVDTYI